MLWKVFFAASKIRAVQIRATKNRASRGMTVYLSSTILCEMSSKLHENIPTDIFFTVNVTRKISYFSASCLRKIAIKLSSSSRRKSRGGRSQRGFAVSRFFLLYFSASQETSFEFLFNTNNITQREINSATTVLHSFIPS